MTLESRIAKIEKIAAAAKAGTPEAATLYDEIPNDALPSFIDWLLAAGDHNAADADVLARGFHPQKDSKAYGDAIHEARAAADAKARADAWQAFCLAAGGEAAANAIVDKIAAAYGGAQDPISEKVR